MLSHYQKQRQSQVRTQRKPGAAPIASIHTPEWIADHWPDEVKNMYVITIREERFKRFLERAGPLAKYVLKMEGMNGEQIDVNEWKTAGKYKPVDEHNEMRRGQIGCFESHRWVWQNLLDSEAKHALIMEDDANLVPTTEIYNAITAALRDIETHNLAWDVLYVARNPALAKIAGTTPSKLLVKPGLTWGLHGYVINRRAAEMLLKYSKCMQVQVDVYVSNMLSSGKVLRGLAIEPIVFHQVAQSKSDTLGIV